MRRAYRPLLAIWLGAVRSLAAARGAQPHSRGRRGPVRFILTLGPGSGTDIGGRLLADRLTKKWGQPVVIENKPGGDGIVAISAFVSAKDDHILLLSPTSSFIGASVPARQPAVQAGGSRADRAGVQHRSSASSVPVASPANSLKELVDAGARQARRAQLGRRHRRQRLHVRGLAQGQQARHEEGAVPQSRSMPASDLAENRVQVYQSAVAIAQPQIEPARSSCWRCSTPCGRRPIPDIPTVAEAGHPALTIDGLVGLFGPPIMPMALRERIAADIKEVMESDPIIKDRLTRTGQLLNPGGPAEFGASIETQRATVTAAANALGIKAKQ